MGVPGEYDHLVKLLLVGNSGVGKSCLLLRFCDDAFTPSFITTIGIDFKVKTCEVNGQMVKVQVWDTAGQERFRTITTSYYRGAHGVLVVYDITDRKTFEDIGTWADTVAAFAPQNAQRILVGNKVDCAKSRQVSREEGEERAAHLGMRFVETSAKSSAGVEDAFITLTSDVVKTRTKNRVVSPVESQSEIRLTASGNVAPSAGQGGGCC